MKPRSQANAKSSAFTLIELLIVVAIIGILASLTLVGMQRVRKSAIETKSVASMKSVIQAAVAYAGENNGQVATMRWKEENKIVAGSKYVSNSFWGQLQPYLFPEITATDPKELRNQIFARLKNIFGSPDVYKMTGTPFGGARIYVDTAPLPVPFAFNRYLHPFNDWVRQQQVYSLPSAIYMTYGNGFFDETDAQSYQEMAKVGQEVSNNIYYLPSKRAIAGFLDGRVEFLAPPIAERMVKIDGMVQ